MPYRSYAKEARSYRASIPKIEVDEFNDRVKPGTMVKYWRGEKKGEPSGTGKTSSYAQVLSGHTAVVWIDGCSGCIALSHVDVA